MTAELAPEVHAAITRLCEAGDACAEQEQYDEAIERFVEAWELLPQPRHDWEAATWILASIGDSHYLNGDYPSALEALQSCLLAPDAIGNPFIHLRLGEAQFELGNTERATDELMRAYMGAGPEIFEDEDEKYLDHLAAHADGIERP